MTEPENREIKAEAEVTIDDAGTVIGIAWPFGKPDSRGDLIEPTAFRFAPEVPMLMEHEQGRGAVGIWNSYAITDRGLEVKGRLFVEGVTPARDARRHLKAGIMSGLSIGYLLHEYKARPEGGRVLSDLTITEISLCRRPVHPDARTTEVKSIIEESHMENEIENAPEANADPVISAAEVKALKDDIATLKAKLNRPAAANNNQPAAENDNTEQKAFANYLRTGEVERKALTVASDAPGYVLAPEETSGEFIRNLVEFSPVRGIADVRSTGSHTVILPKRLTVTNAKWKGETVASEASEPTFGDMEVGIKEMTTHVDVGNWLIEDASHDVEAEIRLALAEDFGAKEGLAFVNGSTAVEPKGFMAEAGIANGLNGHATDLSADALITLMYSLPGVYRNRGTWAMNGTTLAAVRKLKDGSGNYLWQPSYQAGQPETILGRPVVELIDMPDIEADAFPIIFGDFKAGYRIYDRIELQVRPNPYLLATEGLVRFHARRRVGAGVVRTDVFRKLKMATA
ncbi:phage major capsid protein [Sinorhizobium prairiense]|uniref:phage major capsid protein n=1 Tax=unclassified Sinorhizobium TaxID=2613772 RepID=UPI0023D7CA79|nr:MULTISPECIES: phage major capsid protein [unclassified Sinorhizobium]WEJ11184.1 phage major capsid protein [Sinorhizobium sp. M103]WEJ14215.1 phage major capsid protein [Sinorhizobium sp. K101]WEJ38170.1 phage major capsid protein [Sinorhizobium sp. C101]